ncbi:hypothetical protein VTH06DRAFT_7193 [Thermothelomyces fergusii]
MPVLGPETSRTDQAPKVTQLQKAIYELSKRRDESINKAPSSSSSSSSRPDFGPPQPANIPYLASVPVPIDRLRLRRQA